MVSEPRLHLDQLPPPCCARPREVPTQLSWVTSLSSCVVDPPVATIVFRSPLQPPFMLPSRLLSPSRHRDPTSIADDVINLRLVTTIGVPPSLVNLIDISLSHAIGLHLDRFCLGTTSCGSSSLMCSSVCFYFIILLRCYLLVGASYQMGHAHDVMLFPFPITVEQSLAVALRWGFMRRG
jgi:hypothetical protein